MTVQPRQSRIKKTRDRLRMEKIRNMQNRAETLLGNAMYPNTNVLTAVVSLQTKKTIKGENHDSSTTSKPNQKDA